MNRVIYLTIFEILIQNKINNLIKYLFIFLLFCTLTNILTVNQNYELTFLITHLPLSINGFSNFLLKHDKEDGYLELLMIHFATIEIIIAKFLSIFASYCIGLSIYLPIVSFFFNLSYMIAVKLSVSLILVLMLSISLVILISTIQIYFKSNTNFLTLLALPLLIPSLIISCIIIQSNYYEYSLLGIMIGINLILIPISLLFANYLLKNLFNV